MNDSPLFTVPLNTTSRLNDQAADKDKFLKVIKFDPVMTFVE